MPYDSSGILGLAVQVNTPLSFELALYASCCRVPNCRRCADPLYAGSSECTSSSTCCCFGDNSVPMTTASSCDVGYRNAYIRNGERPYECTVNGIPNWQESTIWQVLPAGPLVNDGFFGVRLVDLKTMPSSTRRLRDEGDVGSTATSVVAQGSGSCGEDQHVQMDLACDTNPTATMTWTNAAGVEQNAGATCTTALVDDGATDQDTGAFPGGSVRVNKIATVLRTLIQTIVSSTLCNGVGSDACVEPSSVRSQGVNNGGTKLDLLITIPVQPTTYSANPEMVNVSGQAGYLSPAPETGTRQALVTDQGYVCLGAGVRSSVCSSGTN
eukprot:580198-Prymnesium_polylepis.1